MKNVDLYGRVRHAVLIDGMSSRAHSGVFGHPFRQHLAT